MWLYYYFIARMVRPEFQTYVTQQVGHGQPSHAFMTSHEYDFAMQEQKNVAKFVKNYQFEWLSTPITFVIFDIEP